MSEIRQTSERSARPPGVLSRLLGIMRPVAWWMAAGILLSFAAIGSNVGLMAVSAYLISRAAVALDVTQLTLAIAGVRLFALTRAAFRYGERYVTHLATFRILTQLRVWFYRSIEPLAPARLQEVHSGDLLARSVADIETLENFYVRAVVPPISALLVTALACGILGHFDVKLAAVLLAFLLVTGVALPLASRRMSQRTTARLIATRAQLHADLVDNIGGLADLLALGQASAQQTRVLTQSEAVHRHQERLAIARGARNALTALFTGLAGLTILLLAIPLVSGGSLEGVYLALLPLTAMAAFEAVQPLAHSLEMVDAGRAAAERVFSLADMPPAVVEPAGPAPAPTNPALSVRNLRFAYPSPASDAGGDAGTRVLDGVSFDLAAGQRLAITGPSGAGKSTLAALLLRFWDIGEGEISLGDRDIRSYTLDDVRALMAVVPQSPYFFHTSIRDNLLLADPDASEDAMVAACRQAQIHEFVAALPEGYDTLVGENGLELSGGERQRLAVARALLKDAPILILDEVAAHLDAVTAAQLWQALDGYMEGRTVLILDHGRLALDHADQVLHLDPGQLRPI